MTDKQTITDAFARTKTVKEKTHMREALDQSRRLAGTGDRGADKLSLADSFGIAKQESDK